MRDDLLKDLELKISTLSSIISISRQDEFYYRLGECTDQIHVLYFADIINKLEFQKFKDILNNYIYIEKT